VAADEDSRAGEESVAHDGAAAPKQGSQECTRRRSGQSGRSTNIFDSRRRTGACRRSVLSNRQLLFPFELAPVQLDIGFEHAPARVHPLGRRGLRWMPTGCSIVAEDARGRRPFDVF